MLGRSSMRAGWILKEGGFACGSKRLSASLSRVLLVLFLAGQEKNIPSQGQKKPPVCTGGSRYYWLVPGVEHNQNALFD